MTLGSVPSEDPGTAYRTVIIHDLGAPGCPTRHAGREVHNLPVGSAARRGARPGSSPRGLPPTSGFHSTGLSDQGVWARSTTYLRSSRLGSALATLFRAPAIH